MIKINPEAQAKIESMLAEENNPNLVLRTFVQGGGCSGMSYGFTFDEIMNEDDFEMPLEKTKILIDEKTLFTINCFYCI
jgi:iron-sulfur cluster insertion protein